MSSLDGYSLNEKIDTLHETVSSEIEQLQKDFHNLYSMMEEMKDKKDATSKSTKKSTKKVKKEVAKEVA